ncbi:MAG TPA: pyrroline-5-carboxylate reductase [Coxiellaceae bacterium]|nr:pyrroline-5-carboxylate reductase [Coxiellaceae bacterium]
MTHPTIAFLGAGHLGKSMMAGLLANGYKPEKLWATTHSENSRQHVTQEFSGVHVTTDNHDAVLHADVVVLSVLPKQVKSLLESLQIRFHQQKPLIISVAAGVTVEYIERWLGGHFPIVLAMPNMPSQLRVGATGLYANSAVNEAQKKIAASLFEGLGLVVWVTVPEGINQVLAISGSGPAYFFRFMECMQKTAEKMGLNRETARQLAAQTALGAAKMVLETNESLAALWHSVAVPGGTTEAALQVFNQANLEDVVARAMEAAYNRSKAISQSLGEPTHS